MACWLAGSLQQSFSSFPSQLIDLSILSLRFLLPSSVPPSPLFQSPSCPAPSDPNTPIAGVPSGKTVETWLGDDVNLSSDSPMMRAACPPHPPHRATLRIPATRLTFPLYALSGEKYISFFLSPRQRVKKISSLFRAPSSTSHPFRRKSSLKRGSTLPALSLSAKSLRFDDESKRRSLRSMALRSLNKT